MKTLKYLSCVAAASLTLAGCGGGGASSVTPAASGTPKTAQLSMKVTFNTSSSNTGVRHRNYVSQNTKGLGITVAPTGAGAAYPNNLPTTTAAMRTPTWATSIAPGFNGQGATCTAIVGSSYSCTIILTAPVGYDDFQFTTWDSAPSGQGYGATFASTANNLSFQNIADQLVIVNQTNSFNFTMDGIVKTVVLNLSPNSLIDGAATGSGTNPLTPQLQVRGIDAAGNTIIGNDPWVDSNGNPISVTVAVTANPDTAPSPSPAGPAGVGHLNDAATPTVNDSCKALSANGGVNDPSQGSCVLTYDGGDLDSMTLTASTNSALVGSAQITNATLALTRTANGGFGVPGQPAIAAYAISGGIQPGAVAAGPDHRVWFGDTLSSTIGAMTTSGAVSTYSTAGVPGHIQAGPDGEMWFTEQGGAWGVDVLNTDGTSRARFTSLTFAAIGLTVGPDNKMWVTEGRDIAQFGWDATGAPILLNEYPLTAGAEGYDDVTSGPNGHLWAVQSGVSGSDAIVEIDPGTGSIVNTFPMPVTTDATYGLVAGTDGKLWFGDYTAQTLVSMTTAGVFTAHALTGHPTSLTLGPDGGLWTTEVFPDKIARMDTVSGSLNEYAAVTTATPPAPVVNPLGITTGPDNNLWFTESTGPALGKLTP